MSVFCCSTRWFTLGFRIQHYKFSTTTFFLLHTYNSIIWDHKTRHNKHGWSWWKKRIRARPVGAPRWFRYFLLLHWRHNKHDGASNHQRLGCLLSRLFRRLSKKTSKPRVTGLSDGNPPVTGGFPSQRTSNSEKVSISWRYHAGHRHNNDEIRNKERWEMKRRKNEKKNISIIKTRNKDLDQSTSHWNENSWIEIRFKKHRVESYMDVS